MNILTSVSIFFVIVSVYGSTALNTEPVCTSRFDYDERMLEKMVQVQFDVRQFSKALDAMKSKVESTINRIQEAFQNLKSDVETSFGVEIERSKAMRENLTKEFTEFKETVTIPTVIFIAKRPETLTPTEGSTIVFKEVDFNIGTGYDVTTGYFTAPTKGIYSFTAHLCSNTRTAYYFSIAHNDALIIGTMVYNGESYTCNSISTHILLDKNDRVWVKCTFSTGSMGEHYSRFWNTFNGALIHAGQ